MNGPPYRDRHDAGVQLASFLLGRVPGDVVVLGLPRGGVPVAFEVARALGAPLDVLVVRKLGAPDQPELAMGAIASGDARVVNRDVLAHVADPDEALTQAEAREHPELERRERAYRGTRPAADLTGRTVVLIDDGMATGATMRVAVHAVRARGAERIIVGVPVGAAETCDSLAHETDELCCLHRPRALGSVGAWFETFTQTTDDEVRTLLARASSGG